MESLDKIIAGCINKDARFQRLFYDRFRGYATKVVFRYVYRYDKSVDVVTDGFIKVFNHFSHFDKVDGENLEKMVMGWVKKIMINTAIDELRKGNMLPEIGGIPDYVWDYSDKNYNSDQLVLYKDLISFIKELPPNYRTVFNLYVLDGYSHSQIADMLLISVSTSRSSLSRAKALLQNKIKNMEEGILCRI
ncbi:MAG: RNA polymerase sigma factor [Chitinophagaceae bacterium]|nr:RNA polymerase sigma factor [Chitinophagaceae bacterium]